MPPRCQLLSGSLALPRIPVRAPQSTQRTFTTSSALYKNPLQRRRGGDLGAHLPKHVIPAGAEIPAYPYGENLLFRQSNKGLYGGQKIQFGNNVSPDTETKTRRYWKPNIMSKSVYSVALKKRIKLRITSKVLKTIDREGGLDEYLLKQSEHRIKELGPTGWALRWTLLQTPVVQARMRAEAAALGLAQDAIDEQWPTANQAHAQKAQLRAVEEDLETQEALEQNWIEAADELEAEEPSKAQRGSQSVVEVEKLIRKEEAITATTAFAEYNHAIHAAKRYVQRGLVDCEEDGLKLAFVRARQRQIDKDRNRTAFHAKLAAQFPNLATHTAREQAYREWRSRQIEEAGSYDAWRNSLVDSEKAAVRAAQIDKVGSEKALAASRKAAAARDIEIAESTHQDSNLPVTERLYLEEAIKKANRAIEAHASDGKHTYVRLTLEDLRARRKAALEISKSPEAQGDDAWASLVGSTCAVSEPRVSA